MNRRGVRIVLLFFLAGIVVCNVGHADGSNSTMIGFAGDSLAIDCGSFLSKHDVVYLSPPDKGYDFLPVGNGDLAAPVWTPTAHSIEFDLNKSDTWDGHRLQACGRLTLRLGADLMGGEGFEGRLDLHKGIVSLRGSSEEGHFHTQSLVYANSNVLIIQHEEQTCEPVPRELVLYLWRQQGVQVGATDKDIWLRQEFSDRRYALACRIVGTTYRTQSEPQKQTATILLSPADRADFTVLLAAATTTEPEADPVPLAAALLDQVVGRSVETTVDDHKRWWDTFWRRSFISLSDDYLENLWYLTMYNLACCSRGEYAAKFNGGLWLWQQDARTWGGCYWHFNTQETYWPLYAANHLELLQPYYKTYWRMLPVAKEEAKSRHNINLGAWFAETISRLGYADRSCYRPNYMAYMLSPGTQMALYFWWYYLYTLDEGFLRNRAYPILKECMDFYLAYMKKDEQGTYSVYPSTAYEAPREPPFFKNPVVDLACIRVGCRALLEASQILGVDADRRAQWQEVLEHLPAYPTRFGAGKTLFAQGLRGGTGVMTKGKVLPELTNVFPAGDIGLKDRGTAPFEIAVNTVRARLPDMGWAGMEMGVFAARLGLKEEAWGLLRRQASFQIFPQGFFHYFNAYERYKWGEVKGGLIPYLEPAGVFAAIINESLLQSYDGKIRVFPALPDDENGAFSLRAVGAFVVTSEAEKGEVKYIAIESLAGRPCTVVNPWTQPVVVEELKGARNRLLLESEGDDELGFETAAGGVYLMHPASRPLSVYRFREFGGERNEGPKRGYGRVIGKE